MTTVAEEEEKSATTGAGAAASLLKGTWGVVTPGGASSSSSSSDEEGGESISSSSYVENVIETKLLDWVKEQELLSDEQRRQSYMLIKKEPILDFSSLQPHSYPCPDTHKNLPLHPKQWPQYPILLRPTPSCNMKIRGIRYVNSTIYQTFPGLCEGCTLPINTGYEQNGKSLVIDFESSLFVGTLLLRIKGIPSNSKSDNDNDNNNNTNNTCYFDGKKRQFQVIIRGRFRKENIPVSECVTGQIFERSAGPLPGRFLVQAFIKIATRLAPQLELELDKTSSPRFLTPLAATAHTILQEDYNDNKLTCIEVGSNPSDDADKNVYTYYIGSHKMEDNIEEPSTNHITSFMNILKEDSKTTAGTTTTPSQARHVRKLVFNKIAAENRKQPVFDTNKEYTFEFYQHMLVFSDENDIQLKFGNKFNVGLSKALDGQPLKIIATQRNTTNNNNNNNNLLDSVLWSFDIWHNGLYPYATNVYGEQ